MRISISVAFAALFTSASAATRLFPALCNQGGLNWAQFSHPWPSNTDTNYSVFNPSYFNTVQPNYQGVTYTVGGYYSSNYTAPIAVYGSPFLFASYAIAIDHHGYLYIPQNGTYTIATSVADDILLVWLGANAYSNSTRQNAVLSNTYNNQNPTYSFNATAGQYIPVRFLYGQGNFGWGLTMTLVGPGFTYMIVSGQSSPYLVQYGCGPAKTLAPPFPAFGPPPPPPANTTTTTSTTSSSTSATSTTTTTTTTTNPSSMMLSSTVAAPTS